MTTRIDVDAVKAAAAGRWGEILTALGGIPVDLLDGKHHACPRCGGKDRFRLIDADAGAMLCNGCFSEHNGDGIAALQWATGWDFRTTLHRLAEHLGVAQATRPSKNGRPTKQEKLPAMEQAYEISNTGALTLLNSEKLATWRVKKPPITPEGVRRLGARIYSWGGWSCIGFPGRQPGSDQVRMLSLLRADGEPFPAGEKLQARKAHNLGPNSWLYGVGDALAAATTQL